ncbi:MAG: molybdenum ABC transporter ATP-binding protein [Vicinamibacterales bacterium]|nr:molybdenum ABC transporter ATP-binding protein [Vicinamibacterales bacterium]
MGSRALGVTLRQAAPIPLDVSFTCDPGQVLAIFGPSGSGKTTILRSIAGLYTPSEALVQAGDETWVDTAARSSVPVHRRAVGVVFQDYALFPHLTALSNVMTALGHLPRGERRARAEALLTLVHLSRHRDRRPAALSGGERQRVAVARALARDPAVLLLDEPFAAVDRSVRRHLQDEIDQIRRSLDIPLILVTHDFDDVVRLATHLLLLDGGRMVALGPLGALTSRPDLPWLRETAGLGSLFEATVVRIHASRGLAELAFQGGTLFAPCRALVEGLRVRVRIPAREIILAKEPPRGLSLHNVLSGAVSAMYGDRDADHVVVQIVVGEVRLLAEVTRDAVTQLGIVTGLPLHALIKSLSLEVLTSQA